MSTSLLVRWDPENPAFWQAKGRPVAWRNLAISIPALMLAFVVWSLWSVVVVNLDRAGFHFSKNQLFWLTALPALSGATLRIFYSFLVPIFGGRRFTAISTATLLIPALGMGFALRDPGTGYPTLLILALLCGFGGANFSSSMANISFFFPKAKKGLATGLNAGIGNLGVSVVQFVTPLVISAGLFGALAGDPQSVGGGGGRGPPRAGGRPGPRARPPPARPAPPPPTPRTCGCRTQASCGCRSSSSRRSPRGSG